MAKSLVGNNHIAVAVNQDAVNTVSKIYVESLSPIEDRISILRLIKFKYKIKIKQIDVDFSPESNREVMEISGIGSVKLSKKTAKLKLLAIVEPSLKNKKLVATVHDFKIVSIKGVCFVTRWIMKIAVKAAKKILKNRLTNIPIYPSLFSVDENGNFVEDPSNAAIIVEMKRIDIDRDNEKMILGANVDFNIQNQTFVFPMENGKATVVLD